PCSSRRCGLSWGNFSSRTENSSPRFEAAHVTDPTPSVCRRKAVGICTVIGILTLLRPRQLLLGLLLAPKSAADIFQTPPALEQSQLRFRRLRPARRSSSIRCR